MAMRTNNGLKLLKSFPLQYVRENSPQVLGIRKVLLSAEDYLLVENLKFEWRDIELKVLDSHLLRMTEFKVLCLFFRRNRNAFHIGKNLIGARKSDMSKFLDVGIDPFGSVPLIAPESPPGELFKQQSEGRRVYGRYETVNVLRPPASPGSDADEAADNEICYMFPQNLNKVADKKVKLRQFSMDDQHILLQRVRLAHWHSRRPPLLNIFVW